MNKLLATLLLMTATSCCAQSQQSEPTQASEKKMIQSVINARIATLQKEIPKLEKRLKKSREDYQKRLAALPKGHILICGNSQSALLEEQIARNREELKTFEKERGNSEGKTKSNQATDLTARTR